jgi:hypothetical protein
VDGILGGDPVQHSLDVRDGIRNIETLRVATRDHYDTVVITDGGVVKVVADREQIITDLVIAPTGVGSSEK